MDPRDLKAASKYVNNLLASRGLLRGKEIAFHKPADDDSTPSKIINLVHELLNRRDKEEAQHENLALTIRSLRATETKQSETIQQLKTKTADLERKNALLESAQRSSASTLRTAEAATRQLKDETNRIRTTLSQVRTQCANDIRKRDIQIQKMKERLSDTRARGTRPPIAQCTVVGGAAPNLSSSLGASRGSAAAAEEDSATLTQETTDFLTKLSQDLADENDNLIALLRTTLSTLKAIQGLPDDDYFLESDVPADAELDDDGNPVVAPPANFDDLTVELDSTLYSLKEVLNQPNYVPLEELAERDAEIERLVAKNTTLEEEWRKAIELVDGWNRTLGAKFAEATQEEESRSPRRTTPGKGKGRALVDIVHAREEEREEDMVIVMGKIERRSELSIVQEEEEEEGADEGAEGAAEGVAEEVVEVEEVEVEAEQKVDVEAEGVVVVREEDEEEEIAPEARSLAVRKEKRRKSLVPVPVVMTLKPQASPAKKDRKQKTKVVHNVEEVAEEAAVGEQILAEVRATPRTRPKTPAKTPAKTPRKTPTRGKRKVRISDAVPEMFSADEIAPEVEDVQVQEAVGQTPGRDRGKRKGSKKDAHPEMVLPQEAIEVPQKTPEKKERRRRRGDDKQPEEVQEVSIVQEGPTIDVQPSSVRKDRRRGKAEEVAETTPVGQVSPAKRDRKRKAVAEDATQDSIILGDAPQGRERKRRARKEDVMPEPAQDTQAQPEEESRGRATEEVIDLTAGQDEEPTPKPLTQKKNQRKRRPSRSRTDMDELLELALILPEPTPEPEPEPVISEVQEPPKRRERRSRTRKEDDSFAEDTFARLTTHDGPPPAAAVETPKRNRSRSFSRAQKQKEAEEDSAMVDELAAEPVPVRYKEVRNVARTVSVKDSEEANDGKLSRARRRSLRNRDKYPAASRTAQELTPKRATEGQGRVRKSARARGSLTPGEVDSFSSAV